MDRLSIGGCRLNALINRATQGTGTLDEALRRATILLQKDAVLAARQASEVLRVAPGHPHARLIVGAAHRINGETQAAVEVLSVLAREQTRAAPVHLELALAQHAAGQFRDALSSVQASLRINAASADAWRLLADLHDAAGDTAKADQARARYMQYATRDPRLLGAAAALAENRLPQSEALLRTHLASYPTDIAALRMLAEIAGRLRRYQDAQSLLEQCLQLSPSFDAARHNLAVVLNRQGKASAALTHINALLTKELRNPAYRNLKGAILANLSEYEQSIEVYASVLHDFPLQPKIWLSYGHSLKTLGRVADSIAAYRRAIELEPTLGEAYWSLANLKTFRFAAAEIEAMERIATSGKLDDEAKLHVEYALGKALEDAQGYAASFEHYVRGAALRRKRHPYDASENTRFMERSRACFDANFFAARRDGGARAPDPIFIVGLPRSGSTLIEQILASHSQVEGTMELPDLPQIARELAGEARADESQFFEAISGLSAAQRRELGERYLTSTRVHRKSAAPYFIDKMPNNCAYVGLIHLILPNAKIIDARRHPMGCCFSAFKQHFARGQSFTYGLEDLGHYYRDYVGLMAHVDEVLPGKVHRIFYEEMIEHTERTVRALLDYCGLPFEQACLAFHDNERAVRTASSEQVRQPIFREGLDHWRHYEAWLGPLREVLGPVLENYPVWT